MAPEILLPTMIQGDDTDSEDENENPSKLTKSRQIVFTKECDIWSFAIVMYELICQKLPYEGQ